MAIWKRSSDRTLNRMPCCQKQTGLILSLLALFTLSCSESPDWKVGTARIEITPESPMWMGGFGARNKRSEGTSMPLYVKALAIEDSSGSHVVLIVGEMTGYFEYLASQVAQRVKGEFGLNRDQLLFSATHTHSGPFIKRARPGAWKLDPEEQKRVDLYADQLVEYTFEAVKGALRNLAPAQLAFGKTAVGFAANRRVVTDEGVHFGVTPEGTVDHSVPILKVTNPDGGLVAVVFGYACHNTTLGSENYLFHGDFAGVAHSWLETKHPGALAFFVTGCGADINPNPKRGMDTVQRHGEDLAVAVDRALEAGLNRVEGPLSYRLVRFPLQLAPPPTREDLLDRLESQSIYVRNHATEMLKILDCEGHLMTEYPYTLQVFQFGEDFTLVAMAGEVVVDYSLRLANELGANLWVASHCNDVFAYIPSRRILVEGGYEADSSMMFYGFPGRWDSSIEETIIAKVHEVVGELRVQ